MMLVDNKEKRRNHEKLTLELIELITEIDIELERTFSFLAQLVYEISPFPCVLRFFSNG